MCVYLCVCVAGGEDQSELWEMSGNLVGMECQGYRGYRGILPVSPRKTHTVVQSPSVKHLDQLKRAEMGGRSVSLPGILGQPKEKSSGLLISDNDDVKKTTIK